MFRLCYPCSGGWQSKLDAMKSVSKHFMTEHELRGTAIDIASQTQRQLE
jgi:hypothetical protein